MLQAVIATTQPEDLRPTGAAAAADGAASLERFLEDIGPRAYRFAEIGLRHREDALDAVQEAMLRMVGYADRPAVEWPALFWSILRTRVVDAQRRRGFRMRWMLPAAAQAEDSVDWADDAPDPSRSHDGREAWARLSGALANLPRRQREAFTLRVLEDLDVAGTARAMGCSEGSVKTHLSRAREALQRELEEWR